jgi:ferrous iron transport protein B
MNYRKILLVGNPNVGKSAVFSRLTGTKVIISNYHGSTVEYSIGQTKINNETFDVLDAPGTYSLNSEIEAEKIAVNMLNDADIIINVIDSTNLERNLNLTLQVIKLKKPMIVVLNIWDETKHHGIEINIKKLEKTLNVPVVNTTAVIGEGITNLVQKINEAKISNYDFNDKELWQNIGQIINSVQKITHRHHTVLEKISDILIRPLTGIPLALMILFICFEITRFIAENLISYVLNPLYNNFYAPGIIKFVNMFNKTILNHIFLGTNTEAMSGFGILTTGVYIPLVVVLPYIFSFYLILSIVEDSGYLPRLAVLLDNLLHKVGLHGYGTIPIILGLGCKVPAVLATRILESKREKLIATLLILLIAPCMPQSAMIIAILAKYGIGYIALVFGIIILVGLLSSYFLNKILKGEVPELFVEIPPIRLVRINLLAKKMWMRMRGFVFEAIPLIILGILIINIFELLGVINFISNNLGNVLTEILGLPKELISVIIFGFIRKDISISLLMPYNLSAGQLVISSIFLTLYLPCISTFFVIVQELGIKTALKIIFYTFTIALIICGILRFVVK